MQTQVSNELLKIISYARDEAMRTGNYDITTDHLLLGILRHEDNDACRCLSELGVNLQEMKSAVEGSHFHPKSIAYHAADSISFARTAQNTLNLCIVEANIAGADKLFATHLLLAISNSAQCASLGYLKSVGVDHGVLSRYMKEHDLLRARNVVDLTPPAEKGGISILKIINSPDKIVS